MAAHLSPMRTRIRRLRLWPTPGARAITCSNVWVRENSDMDESKRISRRDAIKWMAAASAALSVTDPRSFAASNVPKGYGTDPKVMETYKPGDVWPLTFSDQQRRLVSALCDVIIPADDKSP